MSFWTDLHFYRPTPPPLVTGRTLSAILLKLSGTGVFVPKSGSSLQVKFGQKINQDARGTCIEAPVRGLSGMSILRSISYDLEAERLTTRDAAALLAQHDRPIYRASVGLGYLRDDIIADLQTRRPDDGHFNLALWDSNIHFGPIDLGTIEEGVAHPVGWMSVSMGGNGYLFPWTAQDLTERAQAHRALRPLVDACRTAFPVDPDYRGPGFQSNSMLDRINRYFDRLRGVRIGSDAEEESWDWRWGVAETG